MILRPVIERGLIQPILRSPLGSPLERRRGGGAWTPAALFASGEQGAWYDPSDISTLFQDSAGTTPVTAAGQSVGRILDKSGRGNHLSQLTATARPIYRIDGSSRPYLEFDGTDDRLTGAGIGLTGPEFIFLYGVSFDSLIGGQSVFGTPRYKAGRNGAGFRFTTLGRIDYELASQYAASTKYVAGGVFDSGFDVTPYRNGLAGSLLTHTSDGANVDSSFYLGSADPAGEFLDAAFYGIVIRRASTSAEDIAKLNAYLNEKTGAY